MIPERRKNADRKLAGYEETEALLTDWQRPDVIDWTTAEEFSRGKQPIDLIPAGVWPR